MPLEWKLEVISIIPSSNALKNSLKQILKSLIMTYIGKTMKKSSIVLKMKLSKSLVHPTEKLEKRNTNM